MENRSASLAWPLIQWQGVYGREDGQWSVATAVVRQETCCRVLAMFRDGRILRMGKYRYGTYRASWEIFDGNCEGRIEEERNGCGEAEFHDGDLEGEFWTLA